MSVISDAFQSGGPGMIPTAICGVLLLGAAILYAVRPEKRYVPLMLSMGVMTLMAGCLGFVTGVIKSIDAMGKTDADIRLSVVGTGESLNNVALALGLMLVASLAASIGAARLARSSPA